MSMKHSLRGIYGDCCTLGANAKTEHEARDEEMWPGVGNALPDACEEGEGCRDEDSASSAQPFVQLQNEVNTAD